MLGLVDGHTHAVWAGDRVHEFAMKVMQPYHIVSSPSNDTTHILTHSTTPH